MAALLAFGVVNRAGHYAGIAPAVAGRCSGRGGRRGELRKLERMMKRIRATLDDAEDRWDIRGAAAKLRLRELKEVAYDGRGEYQYEVAQRRVEAETEYEYDIGMAQRQLEVEALGVAPQLVASSQSPKRRRGEECIYAVQKEGHHVMGPCDVCRWPNASTLICWEERTCRALRVRVVMASDWLAAGE